MNCPPHSEQELELQVQGQVRRCLLRTPERVSQRPALLINLASDRRAAIDGEWFNIVPNVFLAAGHRVAAFDLPCHGELAESGVEGLAGMAAAVARGVDVFAEIAATGAALIDACLERGYAAEPWIVVAGTSRGGLSALHVAAAEPRVLACAVFSPVTRLAAVSEFAALGDHPIVQRSDATALVPALAGRAVFAAMGETDPRVDAASCEAFCRALAAASPERPPATFTLGGETHGDTAFPGAAYMAGAAFLLRQCADHMNAPIG